MTEETCRAPAAFLIRLVSSSPSASAGDAPVRPRYIHPGIAEVGRGVPDYRLYFLDARGHIRRIVAFDCDSDEEAIQFVTDKHGGRRKMELWTYRRKVKTFPTAGLS